MPFPIPAALGIAALAAYAFSRDKAPRVEPIPAAEPRLKPQAPPVQNETGQPRVSPTPTTGPMPQAVEIGKTAMGNPITVLTPIDTTTGKATIEAQIATTGNALGPARVLYDFLTAHGVGAGPELGLLVSAFQFAHNADPKAVKVAGVLNTSGMYDLPTSGALTVYTGNPIAPHVDIPLTDTGPNSPGTAALTASNLYAYLKQHPISSGDATLAQLVKAFQKAVNTDTKYPGPASAFPSARIIREPLTVDGKYGPRTSDALAVVTFERINPNGSRSVYAAPTLKASADAAGDLAAFMSLKGDPKSTQGKALVKEFQKFANEKGANPKLVVDGLWGPKTASEMRKYVV